MFFAISVWLLVIFALVSIAAGYAATRLTGSFAVGVSGPLPALSAKSRTMPTVPTAVRLPGT